MIDPWPFNTLLQYSTIFTLDHTQYLRCRDLLTNVDNKSGWQTTDNFFLSILCTPLLKILNESTDISFEFLE